MKIDKQIKRDWKVMKESLVIVFASGLFASIYYFLIAPELEILLYANLRQDIAGFIYQFISYSLYTFILSFVTYKIVQMEIQQQRKNKNKHKKG
jgi:O-antigen/teichoic acid export membrane protein